MQNYEGKNVVILDKKTGETPLECLERFRAAQVVVGHAEFTDIPMTYAGRLDPMASGKLLVLWGDECKNKEKYLGLDKKYEVEVLFGVETDTLDVLGLILNVHPGVAETEKELQKDKLDLNKYIGKFSQPYPAYSSKTVAGKQLHIHAREGTLPEAGKMPEREVKIYSIQEIGWTNKIGAEIAAEAVARIEKITGDFRQKEITAGWRAFGLDSDSLYAMTNFEILKIRVHCSSGAYMRSLAESIGKNVGTGAIAFSIDRTKIGNF